MGFTKLDDGIIYSSVMGEDDSVFRVWIILLASCKSNGISPLSPIFIKNITGKTIEEINRCLHILSEPDINSRSKNDDGRRIRSVDGGFLVINYKKYRDFTYSDSPEAIKKRMQRDKKGHVPDISGHSASASISSSASTSVESKEGMQGEIETFGKTPQSKLIPPLREWVKKYCEERKNGIDPDAFFDHYETRGWIPKGATKKMKNWQAAVRTWEGFKKKDEPLKNENFFPTGCWRPPQNAKI